MTTKLNKPAKVTPDYIRDWLYEQWVDGEAPEDFHATDLTENGATPAKLTYVCGRTQQRFEITIEEKEW